MDGTTLAAFEQSFIEIALLVGVEKELKTVLTWLGDQDSWLLIIDNAKIPLADLLAGILPPGKSGRILITTQNPEYKMIAQPSPDGIYQLGGLEPEESMTLLLKKAQRSYTDPHLREFAEPIVRELLYSPMAIVVTGAELRNFRGTLQEFTKHKTVTETAPTLFLDDSEVIAEDDTSRGGLATNDAWAAQNVLTFGERIANSEASFD